jgi:hypothetical protein
MHRLDQLTKIHGDVVSAIMNVISGGGPSSSKSQAGGASISGAQSAFSTLEIMAHESTDILPSMELDDEFLRFRKKGKAQLRKRLCCRTKYRCSRRN